MKKRWVLENLLKSCVHGKAVSRENLLKTKTNTLTLIVGACKTLVSTTHVSSKKRIFFFQHVFWVLTMPPSSLSTTVIREVPISVEFPEERIEGNYLVPGNSFENGWFESFSIEPGTRFLAPFPWKYPERWLQWTKTFLHNCSLLQAAAINKSWSRGPRSRKKRLRNKLL